MNFPKILGLIKGLGVPYLVCRFRFYATLKDLIVLLDFVHKSRLHEILVIMNYDASMYSDAFANAVLSTNRLSKIIVYNSPFDKNLEDVIFYMRKEFQYGRLRSPVQFSPNMHLFAESISYHTYFSRKLFIDKRGDIRNAFESKEFFGNINQIKTASELNSIVTSHEFQYLWKVRKDKCDICKDCEFRHMCVDNRLPYEREKDQWYHKTECNYNPYISKWKDEAGYRTLAECGVVSNEHGFSIDHEKIAAINKELWGEE